MSCVNNVILITAVDEPRESLEAIAQYCQLTPLEPIEDHSHCKDCKGLESDIYLISNNYGTSIGDGDDDYLSIEESLTRAICGQNWYRPRSIQLFIKGDSDEKFREITLFIPGRKS